MTICWHGCPMAHSPDPNAIPTDDEQVDVQFVLLDRNQVVIGEPLN